MRRRLSATFDESEYGFSRLIDLLLAVPDVANVETDESAADITVFSAGRARPSHRARLRTATPQSGQETQEDLIIELVKAAELPSYAFESNARKRRRVISALFAAMKSEEPFILADVYDRTLQDNESLGLSLSRLAKYQSVLWQSRCFVIEPEQKVNPLRERLMRLQSEIAPDQDLIFRYETSVTYKLAAALKSRGEDVSAAVLRRVLGLADTTENNDYCEKLIAKVD